MLRILLFALVTLSLKSSVTQAQNGALCVGHSVFTAIKDGNWTDSTVWSGGTGANYPLCAGDLAIIPTATRITLPIGSSATAAIRNKGTLIDQHGTLYLSDNLTLGPGITLLSMGPGSKLDLQGHAVVYAGRTALQFRGTQNAHVAITSSRGLGAFVPANRTTISNWTNVDVSNLADSHVRLRRW